MLTPALAALLPALLVAATPTGTVVPPAAALPALPAPPPLELATFTLPNGLFVVLAPDHRLPQVIVDTWVHVGSRDERPGRTGFAHLFEHLMFMGTGRVPGNQFDVLMESGGGANNASTSEDRTNYFSFGPARLLPTLLWLDADRFQALNDAMTQEKVDLQRNVVRNERRQSVENQPYGKVELVLPEALYPAGHPYHHPVIGSHEDLEAATLADVKDFFATHYVPANMTLVVAGDFDPAAVRPLVERWFGALPARAVAPPPEVAPAAAAPLAAEVRRVVTDKVELPRLVLAWRAPAAFAPGEVEHELLADVLARGPASRLDRRLVQELRLAESVEAAVEPRVLGSVFRLEVTGTPGADLERLKREALAVLATLAREGPSAAELRRVRAQAEVRRLEQREHLLHRADKLNEYRRFLGDPDGFARDLARVARVTAASLRDAARGLGEGRVDLRVLPEAAPTGEIPKTRPPDLAPRPFELPAPVVFRLGNGLEVRFVPRPGTGLFAGHLLLPGGGRAVPAAKAGLAPVLADLLVSGAAGRSAPDFDDAVRALGASLESTATPAFLDLELRGPAARFEPALALLADAALRPNLAPADFEREAALALARVEARPQDPREVAPVVAAAALYGTDDPRGRPVDGWARTVRGLALADVKALAPRLLDPRGAVLVLAGDLEPAAVRRAVEARFGAWRGEGPPAAAHPPPRAGAPGRLVLVDRPGAPQTQLLAVRPVAPLPEPARTARALVNLALGGSFTSRLNQNLREKHGYTYGARSRVTAEAGQGLVLAQAAVQTEVTGPALVELRRELDGLAAAAPAGPELEKARQTARHALVEAGQTSNELADALARAVVEGRPADALRRESAALDAADAGAVAAEARSGPWGFAGFTVVLVGDRAAILPQLAKAGFPAPEQLDAEGTPLPAAGQ